MKGEAILIVEDEGLIALQLSEFLEKTGYRIAGTLYSGEASLETVQDEQPALILMDISLAGRMDGIEAARRIRTRYDIPVIFMSAVADQNRISEASAVSPHGFLTKPVSESQLLDAIEQALSRYRSYSGPVAR